MVRFGSGRSSRAGALADQLIEGDAEFLRGQVDLKAEQLAHALVAVVAKYEKPVRIPSSTRKAI